MPNQPVYYRGLSAFFYLVVVELQSFVRTHSRRDSEVNEMKSNAIDSGLTLFFYVFMWIVETCLLYIGGYRPRFFGRFASQFSEKIYSNYGKRI